MDTNKNETLAAKKATKETKKRKRAEKKEKKKKLLKTEQGRVEVKVVTKQNGVAQKSDTTEAEFIKTFRDTHSIIVEGSTTNFKPYETFAEAGFPTNLLKSTAEFSEPTPIQSQCWPILLANRDVVGIAKTGSGKTLAFGLPGLWQIIKNLKTRKTTQMLVVAPTRELAMQTETVLKTVCEQTRIRVTCLYGGVSKVPQQYALSEGAHVVVATPGRLLDLVGEGSCDLSAVTYLVLDEADRMLDMGFEMEIRKILEYLPPQYQTAMFTATWPTAIQKLAAQFLKDPIRVSIDSYSEGLCANKEITQIVEVIESRARDNRLSVLLKEYHNSRKNRILVFVLYKKEAARVESYLQNQGWRVTSIHSDKSQAQRSHALKTFKDGSCPLLVATDVAARGLDIPQVEYVINYSFPLTIEDYVHRIGRTGRAGQKGISHSFFQHCDKQHAGELVNVLKETNQVVPEGLGQWGLAIKKKEPKLGKIEISQSSAHITFDSDDDE